MVTFLSTTTVEFTNSHPYSAALFTASAIVRMLFDSDIKDCDSLLPAEPKSTLGPTSANKPLSKPRTRYPRRVRAGVRTDPMYPKFPVTKTVISIRPV